MVYFCVVSMSGCGFEDVLARKRGKLCEIFGAAVTCAIVNE